MSYRDNLDYEEIRPVIMIGVVKEVTKYSSKEFNLDDPLIL